MFGRRILTAVIAAFAACVCAGVVLRKPIGPTLLGQVFIAAAAIAAVATLARTAIARFYGRPSALTAPAIGAVVLSATALAAAARANPALIAVAGLNLLVCFVFLFRAIILDRSAGRAPQ